MFIIKYKKIFIFLSLILVSFSVWAFMFFGVKLGIDFKGGALIEVVYKTERPAQDILQKDLETLKLGSILLQPTGNLGYLVKSRDLTNLEHSSILKTLSLDGKNQLEETNFNSIGPSIGKELAKKAFSIVTLTILAIIFFIAFAFRKVSKPVSSWKYSFIAIITLLHDVLVMTGFFVFLSYYYGVELDTLFIVAVLITFTLSISDTIVIFDRIRENLKDFKLSAGGQTLRIQKGLTSGSSGSTGSSFAETVGKSLEQSFFRSICTSMTAILVLLALFFFGPILTKYFALMLIVGMVIGTYSSIFLASPLLVLVEELQNRKK
ncbi:MAG: protein translocase subunit SecF [Patescibacteria group bacterium]